MTALPHTGAIGPHILHCFDLPKNMLRHSLFVIQYESIIQYIYVTYVGSTILDTYDNKVCVLVTNKGVFRGHILMVPKGPEGLC